MMYRTFGKFSKAFIIDANALKPLKIFIPFPLTFLEGNTFGNFAIFRSDVSQVRLGLTSSINTLHVIWSPHDFVQPLLEE